MSLVLKWSNAWCKSSLLRRRCGRCRGSGRRGHGNRGSGGCGVGGIVDVVLVVSLQSSSSLIFSLMEVGAGVGVAGIAVVVVGVARDLQTGAFVGVSGSAE